MSDGYLGQFHHAHLFAHCWTFCTIFSHFFHSLQYHHTLLSVAGKFLQDSNFGHSEIEHTPHVTVGGIVNHAVHFEDTQNARGRLVATSTHNIMRKHVKEASLPWKEEEESPARRECANSHFLDHLGSTIEDKNTTNSPPSSSSLHLGALQKFHHSSFLNITLQLYSGHKHNARSCKHLLPLSLLVISYLETGK